MFNNMTDTERSKALTKLWDNAIIGIACLDTNGKFISANPAFCRITEYTEVELIQRIFDDITHPDDIRADRLMSQRLKDGYIDHYDMKKRYITKTGRVIWVILRVVGIRESNDTFSFYISQISEILELVPPRLPISYPAMKNVRRALLLKTIKDFWPIIAIILGAIGIIFGASLEYLRK